MNSIIFFYVFIGEVHHSEGYINNVNEGYQLNISCSSESVFDPFWAIIIHDDAQTVLHLSYHNCLLGGYTASGDLTCIAMNSNNSIHILAINMTLSHTTVLQCLCGNSFSRAYAFFIDCDNMCTGNFDDT